MSEAGGRPAAGGEPASGDADVVVLAGGLEFGLGLPTVQAIVEAHHGSVRARSTSGQGATFEMAIPAVSALPRPGAIMARCRAE